MAQARANGRSSQPTQRLWVNVATVCRAFDDSAADGATIRGVMGGATFAIDGRARAVEHFEVDADVFIILQLAGGADGSEVQLAVNTVGADGQWRKGSGLATAQFRGSEGALSAQITLKVALWGEQLYWFDVLIDGALITRIPFRVHYQFGLSDDSPAAAREPQS